MSSKKKQRPDRSTPVVQERSTGAPWPFIAVVVVVIAGVAGVGIFMTSGSSDPAPSPDATVAETLTSTTTGAVAQDTTPGPAAAPPSSTPFTAEGPNDLPMPPLPYTSQMSGEPEQVKQAYVFAAQNPGVLGYVPCYCGCELDGHRSNVDCFVESRAANGAVESWDTHGMT